LLAAATRDACVANSYTRHAVAHTLINTLLRQTLKAGGGPISGLLLLRRVVVLAVLLLCVMLSTALTLPLRARTARVFLLSSCDVDLSL
jgi:hypothetical protein